MKFQQSHADIIGYKAVERDNVIGANFESVGDTGDCEYGRGIGCDDEPSIRFSVVGQSVFIGGVEAKAATAEGTEAEQGRESVGGEGNFREHRFGVCRAGLCGSDRGCFRSTCHSSSGGGSGEFFGEQVGGAGVSGVGRVRRGGRGIGSASAICESSGGSSCG
jgi:hypothetical protein